MANNLDGTHAGPEQQHKAAVVVQKHWRRCMAVREVVWRRRAADTDRLRQEEEARQAAATTIQARLQWAVDYVPSHVCSCRAVSSTTHPWAHTHYSSILSRSPHFLFWYVAQAAWRGRCVRQEVSRHTARMQRAAVVVQAAWRGHTVRQRTQAALIGIRRLQAAWRARAERAKYLKMRGATVLLQRAVRRWASVCICYT